MAAPELIARLVKADAEIKRLRARAEKAEAEIKRIRKDNKNLSELVEETHWENNRITAENARLTRARAAGIESQLRKARHYQQALQMLGKKT